MSGTGVMIVNIIVDNEDHAIRIAERVVEERLAAATNVQQAHAAFRLVAGELVAFTEFAVRAITTEARFDALCERVSTMPGIVVPGITASELTRTHPRFEPWLREVFESCGGG